MVIDESSSNLSLSYLQQLLPLFPSQSIYTTFLNNYLYVGFYRPLTDQTLETPTLLTPIIPGITVPGSHLGYFFVTLVVNSIVHECGHALAAAQTGVSSGGFIYGGLVTS